MTNIIKPKSFQACVGPSLLKVHVRDKDVELGLTLCGATAVVQDYKGNVPANKFCTKCLTKMGLGNITPEVLGIRGIT